MLLRCYKIEIGVSSNATACWNSCTYGIDVYISLGTGTHWMQCAFGAKIEHGVTMPVFVVRLVAMAQEKRAQSSDLCKI